MELLGTVDWLLNQEELRRDSAGLARRFGSLAGGRDAAQRKQKLFTDEWLELAINRLTNSTFLPQPSFNLA